MPDISILVEIADYYQLDVREILNGERNAALPEEDGSGIKDVAEYADKEKEKMAVKARIYAIAGICAPNGISDSFAILKNCIPNGIPMMVTHQSSP